MDYDAYLTIAAVITVSAASFSLGTAITKTGATDTIANSILLDANLSPWTVLGIIYLLTVVFTEMITNNSAAILMLPIAIAEQMGVNYLPVVIAVMFAASASFITPIGNQTNLMVMGRPLPQQRQHTDRAIYGPYQCGQLYHLNTLYLAFLTRKTYEQFRTLRTTSERTIS